MRFTLVIIMILALAACGGGDDNDTSDEAGGTQATATTNPDVAATDAALGDISVGPEGIEFGDPIVQANATAADVPDDFIPSGDASDPEVLPASTGIPLFDPNASSEGALPPAGPGTLVASETEEIEPIGDFQLIQLRQEGGRNDTTTIIDVYGDGRIIRDGQAGNIDAGTIALLNQLIRDMNFYGMQGTYMGPPGDEDEYRYRVYVNSGEIDRAINAQDGFMPEQLVRLLAAINNAATVIPLPTSTPEA